mgnify:CR=1 FL=1
MKRVGLGLLTSALAAAALVPLAHAADMALPPTAPAPYYKPAIYDWTGIYFGGQVGGSFLTDTVTETTTTVLQTAGHSGNISSLGFLGGGQVGANYEWAPWVVGIEGSFAWSGFGNSVTSPALPTFLGAGGGFFERATSTPQWIAAATGRFGYASDAVLFYVKGGAAWMNVNYTQDVLSAGTLVATSSIQDTRTGFTAGAGIEYGFTENFSGKIEYDFYDFGTRNYIFPVNGAATFALPTSIKSEMHTLMAGINYRFNWAGGRPY